MSFIAVAIIGGAATVGGALISSHAAGKAAETQEDATKYAADLTYQAQQDALEEQKRQFDISQGNIAPWLEAGGQGLDALMYGLGLGDQSGGGAAGMDYGSLMAGFNPEQLTEDPGYKFRLEEGEKALERSAAARGAALSGGAIKAALKYNSGLASQEYQNTFDRFMATQTAQYNKLAGLSGVGQISANTAAGLGSEYANNLSNIYLTGANSLSDLATQAANARASGYINSANAWNQGLGGLSNIAMSIPYFSLYSKLLGG